MHIRASIRCILLLLPILQLTGCRIEWKPEQHRKEAVLREDLYNLRAAINEFTEDKGVGPESLDDLVHAGYLRNLPADPFTKSRSTWQVELENSILTNGHTSLRIVDVHSGAHANSSEETRYDSW